MCRMDDDRPNVIWIYGDEHRAQAQGHMGDPNLSTPNIDNLAIGGITFTSAVSNCPWCTPFRASLLTGKYAHSCCIRTPQRMDPSYTTIAQVFNEHGYDTAHFGKWHVDGHVGERLQNRHIVPRDRRGHFKTWIGYENNINYFDCFVHGHTSDGTEVPRHRLKGYETDALTNLLIDYIKDRADQLSSEEKPFFAVLSVMPPHPPFQAPPEFMSRHRMDEIVFRPNVPDIPSIVDRSRRSLAGYYAMIENLDQNVGRVVEALENTGLSANTHVLFFSDHGDMQGSHGFTGKCKPWEESVRIPFTMGGSSSSDTKRHGRFPVPINTIDIPVTTLGLCGIEKPEGMEGFDYSGYYRSGTAIPLSNQPDSAFLQHCDYRKKGEFDRVWRGIVTDDGWKYICLEGQPFSMFDLNEDPYELANLAFRYRDIRKRLQDRLSAWINDTGDCFLLPEKI